LSSDSINIYIPQLKARGVTVLPLLAPPTITSVSPSLGTQWQTLSATITGTYFYGVTVVSFGAGITVNSFSMDSSTQITASISIDVAATLGVRDVWITSPLGTAFLTDSFTVTQLPQGPVGGTIVPIDKLGLMMPRIIVASVMVVVIVALGILARRRRAQRQSDN
jgi:hypothetical protein